MVEQTDGRELALAKCLEGIEKQYGKGAIMKLDANPEPVASTSTCSVGLDLALGCGGYPRGRIIEIFGPEASGKTTLALHAIAEVQARGGRCAFIDAEHALDPGYARTIGVQIQRLLLSQPDDGEQAIDIVENLAKSSAVDLVVVDSVAALTPRDELEGVMSDSQVGLQARMMSKAMRRLAMAASKSDTTIIFINQLRQKIGVAFGPSEVTTGGNALKFYASIRLDVRRIGALKKGEEITGNRTRVKVVKNKLAPPFRQVEFDIVYGKGIYRTGELLDLAEERGILTRTGNWVNFGEVRLGNGRDNAAMALDADPGLLDGLAARVRGGPVTFTVAEA